MWYHAWPTMQTKSHDKGLEESILNDEASCFYDLHLSLSELADLINMLLWPVYSIMPFNSSSNTNDFLVVSSSNVVTSAQNPQDTWRRWTSFVDKNLMSSSFWQVKFRNKNILRSVSLFWLRKWGRKYDRQKWKN